MISTRWCPSSLAKLVQISPMSLWFMVDITIVFMGFINQQTSLGGTILYYCFPHPFTSYFDVHLGTRVLTHPHIIIFCAWRRRPSSPHARAECCHRCQARLLGPARCGTELSHQGSPRVTEFTIKRGRWSQKHLEKPWKILVGEKVNSKLYLGKLWRPHCDLSGMMIYANLQ